MQRRAAEESLTDHGKDNSNGRTHVGDAIRHKPGILGFLRQIGFMGATAVHDRWRARPRIVSRWREATPGVCRAGHRSVLVRRRRTAAECHDFRSGRRIWTIGACEVGDVEIMRLRYDDGRWRELHGMGSESRERSRVGQVCFESVRAARQNRQKHVRRAEKPTVSAKSHVDFGGGCP